MLFRLACLLMIKHSAGWRSSGRSDAAKDAGILVLRHEAALVRRRAGRPGPGWADRAVIAALARLPPARLRAHRMVTPCTLPAGTAALPGEKGPTRTPRDARRSPIRSARWPGSWPGRTRAGVAAHPGRAHRSGPPRRRGHHPPDPGPRRASPAGRQFLTAQAPAIVAAGFLHAGTVVLRRL
jgi:hypothetical protein